MKTLTTNATLYLSIEAYFTNSKTFEAAPHPGSLKKDKRAKLIYELCWWVFLPPLSGQLACYRKQLKLQGQEQKKQL